MEISAAGSGEKTKCPAPKKKKNPPVSTWLFTALCLQIFSPLVGVDYYDGYMLCIFHTSKALYALIRCVGENNVKRLYVAGSTGSVVSRVGLG